ncbi:MmgE/PrpD family protein [Roseovarius pelagicus]|uniref:MmgE/PrpD family protein n=1 Tax=Roseovarius pelagicus TaxID=2980108 RepID=A0ABY6DAL1_9RHOB|nr:MmgE/PrpD family protein [Roseovarius pelagicus]UXX83166.1 MmgE/PrpD family protein [Roseovarius pelagicus]
MTMRFAEWITTLPNDNLPHEVIARATDCILDIIGCSLVGFNAPGTTSARAAAELNFRGGDAPVYFSDRSMGATGAAFANSAAASMLDLDDGHRLAMGHPGAAVVPVALAIASEIGASNAELLAAIVIGYEISVRLGAGEIRKSHHTGNWTTFGAVATAARLRGLNKEQIAHALAIAAYHGPRLRSLTESAEMGSHVKESIPWSVVTGMIATDLARAGFTGSRDALDLPDRFDSKVALDGLGTEFHINGVYFKRFSTCRWTHTSVDGLMQLMQERQVSANEIQAIEVMTFREAVSLNNRASPPSLESAQYSLPFSLGVAATLGHDHLSPMTVDVLHHKAAVELARKVKVIHSTEMDSYLPLRTPARVRVCARGEWVEKLVIDAWGDSGSSTARADLRAKFQSLASKTLNPPAIEAIIAAVGEVHLRGVRPLNQALTNPEVLNEAWR